MAANDMESTGSAGPDGGMEPAKDRPEGQPAGPAGVVMVEAGPIDEWPEAQRVAFREWIARTRPSVARQIARIRREAQTAHD